MSDGTTKAGVEYNPQKDLSFPYTEREYDYDNPDDAITRVTGREAIANTDQQPVDRAAAKVRTYDIAGIQAAAIAKGSSVYGTKVQLGAKLPPILKSVIITFNKVTGNGAANYPISKQGGAISGSGAGTLSVTASAEASVTIIPSVVWDIEDLSDVVVDAQIYEFWMLPGFTVAQVISKLNIEFVSLTLTNLPKFRKAGVQLDIQGSQISVQQKADSDINVAVSGTNSSEFYKYGDSYSTSTGAQNRIETIPPTIHAAITLASNTDSGTATTTVVANILANNGISLITNEPTPITITANGSVKYGGTGTIPATSIVDVPRTGNRLVDVTSQLDDFGLVSVRALVVDFVQYA